MKKFQHILIKTMLILIPITLVALGVQWSVKAVASQITKEFTQPFLVQSGNITVIHKSPKIPLTTKALQIEYTVLKVPAAKTTAAKK